MLLAILLAMYSMTSLGTLSRSCAAFLRKIAIRVSSSGGCTSVSNPHSNRLRSRSSKRDELLGRTVAGDDDLLVRVVQRVERVEELFLRLLLVLQELDVVDQQHVDVAVAPAEALGLAVANRVDEVVGELLGADVPHARAGEQAHRVVADGVQQVCLAKTRLAVDEQRVVRLRRRLRDRDGRRVGEPVARADDEGLEGVLRVEPRRLEVTSSADFATGAQMGVGSLGWPGRCAVALVAKVAHVRGVIGGVGVVSVALVLGGLAGGRLDRRFDRDGDAGLAAELGGERGRQRGAQPGLEHVLGEIVRSGEEHGVLDDGERTDERDPGLELGGQLTLVGQPARGALPQLGEVSAVAAGGV